MKFSQLITAGITSIVLSSSAVSFAFAADAPAVSATQQAIVVVDAQKIIEGSTAFKKLKDAADNQMKNLQKEANDTEESFKKKLEELDSKKATIAKEELEKKSQSLSKDFKDAQQKLSDKKTKIDTVHSESMQKIIDTFLEAVKEESTKSGAQFTFQKSQLLFIQNESNDITSKVLANLNKRLASVDAKF